MVGVGQSGVQQGGSRVQATPVPVLPRVLCGLRGVSESWCDGGRAQGQGGQEA